MIRLPSWLRPALLGLGLLAPGAGLVGCAASAAEVAAARGSVYQTDYTTVYNTALDEVKHRYKRTKVEDAIGGKIISDWVFVQKTQDSTTGVSDQTSNQSASAVQGGHLARVIVAISPAGGPPPYKIFVDVEGAAWTPDLAMIRPFKHGTIEEPDWVNGRRNAMYVALYGRLKASARPAAPPAAVPPADTAPPAETPPAGTETPATPATPAP